MNREFVSYEIALKLKVLGFDEPCFAGYNENPINDDDLGTLIYPTIKLDFEDEDIIFNDTESDEPNCWTIEHDVILAPTYSQAFRWFREKYNLYPSINIYNDKWMCLIKSTVRSETEVSGYIVDAINKGYPTFNTYEEAEIACLENLIELVESKSE